MTMGNAKLYIISYMQSTQHEEALSYLINGTIEVN